MKIPNRRELQQIAVNHSSDIDFKNFIILMILKIYKKRTAKPCPILVHDTTVPSGNPLKFIKNHFK